METKTFSVVTSISMALAITAVGLSIIGVAKTGFYPRIIVLLLVALIPIASKFYAKKLLTSPIIFREIIIQYSQLLICYQSWSCCG
jgi:hypothetical protein